MARPKGTRNARPSAPVLRQILRQLTAAALQGDVQAAIAVLAYTNTQAAEIRRNQSQSHNVTT